MRTLRDTLRTAFGRPQNRRRAPRPGTLEHIRGFESKILGNSRDVTIYLPPDYSERAEGRYPVLYMQDGQNLFEPERSFIPGQHWRLREAADEAIHDRNAEPMIIVGVDHAGPARIDELTPTHDAKRNGGGKAADYARMLIEELKPIIDAAYRTQPDRTALGGSSLGGLLTLSVGLANPNVFSRLAAMSPSVWWDNRKILGDVDAFDGPRPRIWLDIGGREGMDALRDVRLLRQHLLDRGWRTGVDLHYFEDRRADHSERSWAKRAKEMLEYLFPATSLTP